MHATLAAIREQFTEPANLTPADRKAANAIATEARDLAKLQDRGVMAEPSPSPYSAEESALQARVREAAGARARAVTDLAAARHEHQQAQMAHNSISTRVFNPNAVLRAQQQVEMAEQFLIFTDGEEREARLAFNRFKRRQANARLAAAHAEIREQDRKRAEQRRAQGIPPVPRGEVFVIDRNAFRKVG